MHRIRRSRGFRLIPCAFAFACSGLLGSPTAEAKGTFFLVEIMSGMAESAYLSGEPEPAFGLSAGTTFKLRILPVRWYLLASAAGRTASRDTEHVGITVRADRRDVDLYVAHRTVLPFLHVMRVYAEIGVGERFTYERLRRGSGLDALAEQQTSVLLVLAMGLQARLSRTLSLGVRGELTPLPARASLSLLAAELTPTERRAALLGQLGIHF